MGHRFLPDQGEKNMFPQDPTSNNSAYRIMENEMADWTAHGMEVHVYSEQFPPGASRPEFVFVQYEVVNPLTGLSVYGFDGGFFNAGSDKFVRVGRSAMPSIIDQ